MPVISPETIQEFAALQNQIWQTISLSVSDAVGQTITFSNPLTVAARTSDMYSEISEPLLAVQFSFSGLPESTQAILVPPESVLALAELITGNAVTEVDDNVVADVRGAIEAVVQGVCLAAGQATRDTVVASGLIIRHQMFAFPPNLQRNEEIARTQVAIAGDGLNGTVIWLTDDDTVEGNAHR